MTSRRMLRLMTAFYVVIFFAYLFGPLIVMSITAFNTESYPRAYPFTGLTFHWFSDILNDRDMMLGLQNSVIIGIGVVCVSVPRASFSRSSASRASSPPIAC